MDHRADLPGQRRILSGTLMGMESFDAASLVAALKSAHTALGTANPPPIDGVNLDDLVELADEAVAELREFSLSEVSGKALDAAHVAFDLAELSRSYRLLPVERRANGLSSVQRALAELRQVGSVELMLRRSTQVICERIGYDRAILFRLDGDTVYPASSFDTRDPESDAKLQLFRERIGDVVLGDLVIESEMIRRRMPAIVHDAPNNLRAFRRLIEASGVTDYVAAPIVPEGKAIGFLYANAQHQRRPVDIIDRDILWAFAEGYGYALERTILRDQVRRQRHEIAELLQNASELVHEIGDAELRIENADTASANRSSPSLPAGGSRVHALLTPREIEVMELLVHGSTNKQIAERLVVTEATAKSHVTNIFKKLRAANRAEAVHRYIQLVSRDHA